MTRILRALALGTAPLALLAPLAGLAAQEAPAAADATTPGKPVPGTVPLTVLSQLPAIDQPVISPDGTKAVVTAASNGDRAYAIIDLTESGAKPVLIATAGAYKEAGDRRVMAYRWVGDKNVVLTLASRDDVGGYRFDASRLVGFNLDSRKLTPIGWDDAFGSAADILYIDHDKGRLLLSRTTTTNGLERRGNPEVVWTNVRDGKVDSIVVRANPVVSGWLADSHGVVRMGFGYDRRSGRQRILYRSGEGDSFRTVSNDADENFTGDGIQPSLLLDEPDMALVTSNKDGHSKVYKANLATMTLQDAIFGVDGYDVGGVIPSKDRSKAMGVAYVAAGPRREWFDPRLKEVQASLDETFGMGNAEIESTDADRVHRLIVKVAAPSQPGSYYVYDVETGRFSLIGYANDTIKDGKLNPVSAMTYNASDGQAIEAIVTTPRHRVGQKNLPVVVLTHGGPFGPRDNVQYDTWAQAVAEQGYVVIQPNYRGSGGYGRDFLKAGRDNGFGTRMQDDLDDAVTELAKRGLVDPKRACMMGWSYGGYASARAAQRDPDKWRCTVAGAGVYDLVMMKRSDAEELGKFSANYLAAGAEALSDVSPALNTKGKWAPILIVHGVRDPRVPINQARTLVSRLKGSGKKEGVDFDYIEQPKNGHYSYYFTEAEQLEWLKGATDWFARFNPAYLPGEAKPNS